MADTMNAAGSVTLSTDQILEYFAPPPDSVDNAAPRAAYLAIPEPTVITAGADAQNVLRRLYATLKPKKLVGSGIDPGTLGQIISDLISINRTLSVGMNDKTHPAARMQLAGADGDSMSFRDAAQALFDTGAIKDRAKRVMAIK